MQLVFVCLVFIGSTYGNGYKGPGSVLLRWSPNPTDICITNTEKDCCNSQHDEQNYDLCVEKGKLFMMEGDLIGKELGSSSMYCVTNEDDDQSISVTTLLRNAANPTEEELVEQIAAFLGVSTHRIVSGSLQRDNLECFGPNVCAYSFVITGRTCLSQPTAIKLYGQFKQMTPPSDQGYLRDIFYCEESLCLNTNDGNVDDANLVLGIPDGNVPTVSELVFEIATFLNVPEGRIIGGQIIEPSSTIGIDEDIYIFTFTIVARMETNQDRAFDLYRQFSKTVPPTSSGYLQYAIYSNKPLCNSTSCSYSEVGTGYCRYGSNMAIILSPGHCRQQCSDSAVCTAFYASAEFSDCRTYAGGPYVGVSVGSFKCFAKNPECSCEEPDNKCADELAGPMCLDYSSNLTGSVHDCVQYFWTDYGDFQMNITYEVSTSGQPTLENQNCENFGTNNRFTAVKSEVNPTKGTGIFANLVAGEVLFGTGKRLSGDDSLVDDVFYGIMLKIKNVKRKCEKFCGFMSSSGCYCDESCYLHHDCCEDVCHSCGIACADAPSHYYSRTAGHAHTTKAISLSAYGLIVGATVFLGVTMVAALNIRRRRRE